MGSVSLILNARPIAQIGTSHDKPAPLHVYPYHQPATQSTQGRVEIIVCPFPLPRSFPSARRLTLLVARPLFPQFGSLP
jgi:hypothetical protein